MAINEQYRRQVTLLVRTLPIVAQERCFALKGGTAINLFVRDMPRLSIDIDLTYLPLNSWAESTADIRLRYASPRRRAPRSRRAWAPDYPLVSPPIPGLFRPPLPLGQKDDS